MNDLPAAINVRAAAPADAPAIARARVEGWRAAYPGLVAASVLDALDEKTDTARLAARIDADPDVRQVVAERKGDVAGFCAYGPDREEPLTGRGEIYAIYVRPMTWRRGVGSALLDFALADLTGRGVSEVRLWALAGNSRAREFYAHRGFRPDGTDRALQGVLGAHGGLAREVRYVRDDSAQQG
jgi:ribosomal protein S18 acetylase RimI-like enzyme